MSWRQPFDVPCYACGAIEGRLCRTTARGVLPGVGLRKVKRVRAYDLKQNAHSVRWVASLHGQKVPMA